MMSSIGLFDIECLALDTGNFSTLDGLPQPGRNREVGQAARGTSRPSAVPESVRPRYQAIVEITDAASAKLLDAECAQLGRKMAAELALDRPPRILQGRAHTWAAGLLLVITRETSFDTQGRQHCTVQDLARACGASVASAQAKAKEIESALGIVRRPNTWAPAGAAALPLPVLPGLEVPPNAGRPAKARERRRPERSPQAEDRTAPLRFTLEVTLRQSKPRIWRRIEVAPDCTLGDLHEILQRAMGWTDSHLHHFRQKDRFLGAQGDADWGRRYDDERKVRLRDLMKKVGDRLVYEYDFGDGWQHDIVLRASSRGAQGPPLVVAGKGACPPEDVGGIPGYARFLSILADPRHPEHRDMRAWAGGPFDPARFELARTNALLARLRR